MTLTIGSLFSGALGLDRAAERAFGAETVWVSDIDKGACKVLAYRAPGVPNLGDITTVDWRKVQPVDVITGGSPCQDISTAGRLAGMTEGTRSNLWVEMREAIRILQPAYVVWENVRGAYSARATSAMESDPRLLGDHNPSKPALRALGRVLGDLAALGFDAEWHGLRASDVGAPHARLRVFVVASHPERVNHLGRALDTNARRAGTPIDPLPTPTASDGERVSTTYGRGNPTLVGAPLPTPSAGNFNAGEDPEQWEARRLRVKESAKNGNGMGMPLGIAVKLLPTPSVADALGGHERRGGKRADELLLKGIATHQAWGPYATAIAQWEAIHGPAPAPTKPGRNGRPKLNPAFAEWMMGAPSGWITDTPGVTDNEAFKMVGNGVVERQALAALHIIQKRTR